MALAYGPLIRKRVATLNQGRGEGAQWGNTAAIVKRDLNEGQHRVPVNTHSSATSLSQLGTSTYGNDGLVRRQSACAPHHFSQRVALCDDTNND